MKVELKLLVRDKSTGEQSEINLTGVADDTKEVSQLMFNVEREINRTGEFRAHITLSPEPL
jgi:predicted metal-binding protein